MSRISVEHPSQIRTTDPLEVSPSIYEEAYPVSYGQMHQNAYPPMNVSNDSRSVLMYRPGPSFGFGEQLPPISSLIRECTVSDVPPRHSVSDPSFHSPAVAHQQPYVRNPNEPYARGHTSSFSQTIDAYSLPPPLYDSTFDPTMVAPPSGYSDYPYSASNRVSNGGEIDHAYSRHPQSERSSADLQQQQHSQSPSSASPPPTKIKSLKQTPDAGVTASSRKGEDGKVKKHVCACGKAFSTSGHLSRHERTHTNIKPFACPIPNCTSRFSRHDNMRQHFRSHQRKLEIQREQRRRLEEWQRIQDGVHDIIDDTLSAQAMAAQRPPAMGQPPSRHRHNARSSGPWEDYEAYDRSQYSIPAQHIQMQPVRGYRPPSHSSSY